MAEYALRLENGTDTAPRVRLGDALPLQHDGPLNARSGLRRDGGGDVSAVAGAMQVSVAPFTAWVDGGASDAQAGYPFILDAAKTLTIADGDAVLERIDTIAVVVNDDTYDASGLTQASVQVVAGVPGAGAPTLPTTALPLRDVVVPAGLSAGTGGLSSSNIGTDRREYLASGVLTVSGATERTALTAVAGQLIYRADSDTVEKFNGTAWVPMLEQDDTGWITPTYQNGWSARDGDPAYRRLNGVLYMRGRIQRGSYNGVASFTLPAGFRPAQDLYLPAPAGNAYGRLDVKSTGAVIADTAGSNSNAQSITTSFPVG